MFESIVTSVLPIMKDILIAAAVAVITFAIQTFNPSFNLLNHDNNSTQKLRRSNYH